MYVSKERVVRDGYLIAHEGEEMTDDDAKARGLIDAPKPKTKAKRAAAKKETEATEAEAPDEDAAEEGGQ